MDTTLPKYNESTGASWCSRRERKKLRKSETAGKLKGETCQADYLKRHMAKCSRSYKHKLYREWLKKTRELSSH